MSAHNVDATASQTSSAVQTSRAQRFWPEGWWRLTDFRIGIVPLPIYVLLIGLIAALVAVGEIKPDGPTMIVVLVVGGFTCAEIGKRIPVLRNIGAGAIFATFIPSALAYYHLIPRQIETSIVEFTKSTNFLYLFIASIIVGPSDLISPTATSAAIRPSNKTYTGKGIIPIRKSSSRHQPSGQKTRDARAAESAREEIASTSCVDMLFPPDREGELSLAATK